MIEFQNRYNKTVRFQYIAFNPATQKAKDVSDQYSIGEGFKLKPGESNRLPMSVIGEGNPMIRIFSVCFEFWPDGQAKCSTHAVAGNASFGYCDNGIPNYKIHTAREEKAEEEARLKSGDPNYVHSETSKGLKSGSGSTTDLIDQYAKLLGVQNSGSNRYSRNETSQPSTSPAANKQPVAPNTPATSEITEKDFTMDMTPYNPLYAKDQAGRFVAGFTKRPGVLITPSGVLYQVLTAGTGVKPTATDNVKVNFRKTTVVGRQYKDVVVADKGETINMAEIGPMLSEGIRLMSVGSKFCFVFPARLAGKQPDYPEGSVSIVWVIELLEVVK